MDLPCGHAHEIYSSQLLLQAAIFAAGGRDPRPAWTVAKPTRNKIYQLRLPLLVTLRYGVNIRP